MAYAVKYLFKFQSSNGTVREIRVLQDGYSGAVIQRPLGRAPVIKKEQNGGVHGTSLTFYAECHVDREFIEFYTSDPKEYRVDVYAGSTLLWQGYITPELYSEPDIAPPYDVEVVATDGVGELKLYDFAPQGTVTLRSLLSYLLGYTGLSTDVNLVSSLKPGSHGAGALLDMQICVDYLEGKTCYEALTYLLDTLHATITRWGGAWLLVRETNVTFTNDKVRYFNTAGNSALLSGSVQTLGALRSAPAWPVGQLSMVIDPAKNKVAVQAPWHPVTCLANADMTSDTAWAKANNASYGPDGYLFPNNDTGGSSYATAHISQSIASAGLRVPMSFELKATGVAAQVGARVGAVIGVLITYTVGNMVYLLRRGDEGTPVWKEGSAPGASIDGSLVDYQQPLASFDADRIQAETLNIDEIPAFVQGTTYPSGTLTVYVIGTCARAYSAHLDVVLPKGYQDVLRIDNGARGEGDTVEIAIGRETADAAYYSAFLQGLLLDNGALITNFTDANFTDGMNYLALIARDYALSVALPRASVKGTVYLESSIGVPPLVFAKGGLNYWIETWSWDLYEDELEISARTLPSASLTVQSETILESDGSTVSSASTTGSSGGGGGSFPGGVNYFELDDTLVRLKGQYDYLGPRKGLIFEANSSEDVNAHLEVVTKNVGGSNIPVLHSRLPFYSDSFVSAGGISPGGGSEGTTLEAVWGSLVNGSPVTPTTTTKIAAAHIPIGEGLGVDGSGNIYVTSPGIVTSVAGVSPVNGDIPVASLKTALNLGAAASYGVGTVASGDGGLVTGGAVHSAINDAISSAIKFQGITTTALTDGSTTNPITIDGQSYTAKKGDVVLYDGKEFLWTGSAWEQLGDEASWALKTTTISAGTGLTGGGTLASNRTISLSQATQDSLALANTALQSHQTIYALTIKNSAGTNVLSYTPNSAAGSLTLTKAMVGLGNVDNTAAADYFTVLENSSNQISLTIGGTNKKLTVAYATKASQDSAGNQISTHYLPKATFDDMFEKVALSGGGYAIKAKYGLYTDQFLSAGGLSSGGGSGGIDLDAMWASLTTTTDGHKNDKIHTAHLPTLSVSTGLTASYTQTSAADTTLNLGIASGYKLPTTTEWSNKADASALGNYVAKAGDTMTGGLTFSQTSSTRRNGIIGTYDANRAAAIWSMGSAYQIATDGLTMGNLYGACYAYYGSGYTYGAGKSGGHSFVWVQNGSPTVALGDNVWTSGGYIKNGGTSAQFLKADGSVDSNTYLTTTSAASLYLPLTGGTMTGALTISKSGTESLVINRIDTTPFITFKQNGTICGYIGVSSSGTPIFYDTTARAILHSGNFIAGTNYVAPATLANYLPLSAGSNYKLSGTLYIKNQALRWTDNTGETLRGFIEVESDNTFRFFDGTRTNYVYHTGNASIANSAITLGSTSLGTSTAPIGYATHATNATAATYADRLTRRNGTPASGGYDLNTILTGGGITSQYGSGSYWKNGPSDMTYGGAMEFHTYYGSAATGSTLNIQFAWDINHNTSTPTRYLWYRSANNLGWANDWHLIYDSGNSNKSDVAWSASDLTLGNTGGVYIKGSGGAATDILRLNSSNSCYLGSGLNSVPSGGILTICGVNIYFDTSALNGSWATRMTINSVGNVGIGTTSPGYKLDVNGGARVLNSVFFLNAAQNGNAGYVGRATSNDDIYMDAMGAFKLVFRTNSANRAVIDSSGNVGIGTVSPTQKLHVDGTILSTGGVTITSSAWAAFNIVRTGTGNSQFGIDSGGLYISNTLGSSSSYMYFRGGYGLGIGKTPSYALDVSGSIAATGAVTAGAASDARLKTNINTMSDAQAKALIMALRPVTFTWNQKATELYDQYKGNDLGFIAQEVEPLCPKAIGTIFNDYKRLDPVKFIAPIVKVEQDHERRIRELEKAVKARDEKIEELEKRLNTN